MSLLLLLQTRDRITAQELATALEVSVRTIYRDIEALSGAGVPVYGEAGHGGGYQLLAGYQTRLTGLSPVEADALFLTGLAGAATSLGLGTAADSVRLKLRASLPTELRDRADRVADRIHLDDAAWYQDRGRPPHLQAVATATWNQQAVRIRYRRWAEPREVTRLVHPHGLVLKGGHWYLVARGSEAFRTYRISRILDVEVLSQSFERAAEFDLAGHWKRYLEEYDQRRHRDVARLRLSPRGVDLLPHLLEETAATAAAQSATGPDARGWTEVAFPIESIEAAVPEILKLAGNAEVLAPEHLRSMMLDTLDAMNGVYGTGGQHRPSSTEV